MNKRISEQAFELFRQGDQRVFESIYLEYCIKITRFIYNFTNSKVDSEELTQEVFVKLWENRKNVMSSKSLASYIYTIAKNEAFRYVKNRRNTTGVCTDNLELCGYITDYNADNHYQALEYELQARCAIAKLPKQMGRIFEMSAFEDMSNDDISKLLNIKKESVENAISKARKVIKKAIFLILSLYFIK